MQNLKKWTEDWNIHIIQACELYFDNKEVNYLKHNIFRNYFSDDNGVIDPFVYAIKIEFEYNGNNFLVDISHLKNVFSINCYYKDYNIKRVLDLAPSIALTILGHFSGTDSLGMYTIVPVAGQSSYKETPCEMLKTIENMILTFKRNDGFDNNGFDNDDRDNDPIEPCTPINSIDLSPALNC